MKKYYVYDSVSEKIIEIFAINIIKASQSACYITGLKRAQLEIYEA